MKKIKQWFIGLIFALYGTLITACFVAVVLNFIAMMNSVGWEFAGYFCSFIFDLALSVFMPYICFKQIADGVKDKYK